MTALHIRAARGVVRLLSCISVPVQGFAPLLFLFVLVLAFGLQIPWLGYYLDDWIILHALELGGLERVFEYAFIGNRPLVAWIWWLGHGLLGANPVGWQLWSLAWRWLAVVMLWLGWLRLWPKAAKQLTLAALLFAVYPLFRQQPTALTYSFHWIGLFLYALSVYWMILSVQRPQRFTLYLSGALVANILQLFSQEFYVGLELLRPIIIWLALGDAVAGWKQHIRRTLYYWAVYLVVFGLYLVWRFFLMPTPGSDRNAPDLLLNVFSTPAETIEQLAVMILQNTVEILFGAWYATFQPRLIAFSPVSSLVAWALVALTFVLLLVVFGVILRPKAGTVQELPVSDSWQPGAMVYGVAAMFLGFLPGWVTGRHINDPSGIYNDRFGMAAMFGAAILVLVLLDLLLRKESYRVVIACLLVSLAVGQGFRQTSVYRWSWEKQRNLYWQMKWRAPGLREPTAVLGDGAMISFMGSWATISALAQLYLPQDDQHWMDIWYFDVTRDGMNRYVEAREPWEDEKNFMRYRGGARESLAIWFQPEAAQCLWVLRPEDQHNPYISEDVRYVLPLSNLDQILPEDSTPMREDIFGPEISHSWCYYYQKGDLARQAQDWQWGVDMWNAAVADGKRPRVGVEYIPFIEAFAHTGRWQQALELTNLAKFPILEMRGPLCAAWGEIEQAITNDAGQVQAIRDANGMLGCESE